MRLSLSINALPGGYCSKCGLHDERLSSFTVLSETHTGDAEPLCSTCVQSPEGLWVSLPTEPLVTGPTPRRKALKKAKKTSLKQELDIAEALGGRAQPGSGNQRGAKGDVRKKGELRVEAKFTTAASFSLKLDELYKIAGECEGGEKPVFVIDFLESGTRKQKDRFAVLHFNDFQELLNAPRKY